MHHKSDDGQPCTRHAAASLDSLLALATIGTRGPGFQHDIASKIQSLVMTMEEIGDRAEVLDDTQLTLAVNGARAALTEMTAQLQAFRALCRRTAPSKTPVPQLLARAAERASLRLRGQLPAIDVVVAAHEVVHATALLLDGACGHKTPREVEIAATPHGFSVPLGASSEQLAVATFVFDRNGGELRCSPTAIVVSWTRTPG